jgi:IS30 family transposase
MTTQFQKPHKKYTKRDLICITDMVKAGKGRTEIGAVLGRHKDSIGGAIKRYNLPKPNLRRKVPDDVVAEIKRLWSEGWTGLEIATKLGRTRSGIHGIIARKHFTCRRPDNQPLDEHGEERAQDRASVTLPKLDWMHGTDGRGYIGEPT